MNFICFRCRWKVPALNKIVYSSLNTLSKGFQVKEILNKLSISDQINLCISCQISVPGVWPLLFKSKGYLQPDLEEFFPKDPFRFILRYLKTRSQIILPKHILVLDHSNYRQLFFGEIFTAPSEWQLKKFHLFGAELDNVFVISSKQYLFTDEKQSKEDIDITEHTNQDLGEDIENEVNADPSDDIFNSLVNADIGPISGPTDPDFISRPGSQSTFETIPKSMRKTCNIFLNPEKASSEDLVSLIHITKPQFLQFVELIDIPVSKNQLLTKYSASFLFRLKLASNWSFDELGTVFCIDRSTARRIFWKVLKICYSTSMTIPNILNEYTDMEAIFHSIYEAQDPYFTKLFSGFQDPTGKYFNYHVLYLKFLLFLFRTKETRRSSVF